MIHQTALIHPDAMIEEDVSIGPYCVVGPYVSIGNGTRLMNHVILDGRTTIGKENTIFPFASIGLPPQDKKYRGEDTRLKIGNNNVIREYVTMSPGTKGGGGLTEVEDDNLFMAYSHVAHDCRVGSRVVFANGATLAGHVYVADDAIIGGLSAVHQFVRIGRLAMIGGGAMVSRDVPPFMLAVGDRAKLYGVNTLGLRRHGFDDSVIRNLKRAYRLLFRSRLTLKDALERLEGEDNGSPDVVELVRFIRNSKRGICRG